jgi:hypothetical protein
MSVGCTVCLIAILWNLCIHSCFEAWIKSWNSGRGEHGRPSILETSLSTCFVLYIIHTCPQRGRYHTTQCPSQLKSLLYIIFNFYTNYHAPTEQVLITDKTGRRTCWGPSGGVSPASCTSSLEQPTASNIYPEDGNSWAPWNHVTCRLQYILSTHHCRTMHNASIW